jgi:adenylosuccinate lyase
MQPLSPLDGRYASRVDALRPFFTEEALNRARLNVEILYFLALSAEKGIPECPSLSDKQMKAIKNIAENFDEAEHLKVLTIEKTTNHDVKAVEYYLAARLKKALGKAIKTEFIHFGLTSEDVNNLAYGMLITAALKEVLLPELQSVMTSIRRTGQANMKRPMLSLTHGQPATPTTLGKELMVFAERLERQAAELRTFKMQGKFGGAVGNYSAHRSAYPRMNWEAFGKKFLTSLKLHPLTFTTQINPHDDLAELSHLYCRINTIFIDCSRDIWSYISRGVFGQKTIQGEVGSSTMPHKVNPIDFENAEGNLGLSSALFSHFAEKLPISRLQRDLSDSTVQRNIGIAFGYHLLALRSFEKGWKKLSVNHGVLKQELAAHPEVLTEAIQTVMRKNGVTDAYEQMKAVSRGQKVTLKDLQTFVQSLKIDADDKERLLSLLR